MQASRCSSKEKQLDLACFCTRPDIVLLTTKRAFDSIVARNFGRSLRIPDASLQTSVNFPRTRPLKCMEQTAFLFNLNQERAEMKNSFKITVKHIISYALFMK